MGGGYVERRFPGRKVLLSRDSEQTQMTRIAVLDDWQGVARDSTDWSRLAQRAQLVFFERPLDGEDAVARALTEFDVIIAMRERTRFPASLIARLRRLRMIALTGSRSGTMDIEACTARGIVVCNTAGQQSTPATAELALGLLLAAAAGDFRPTRTGRRRIGFDWVVNLLQGAAGPVGPERPRLDRRHANAERGHFFRQGLG